MGLPNELEIRLEEEMPQRLQESSQGALDEYRAQCVPSGLLMYRHNRCPRDVMTGYGEVRLQITVSRCSRCREMSSGMSLLGDEVRFQRYSRKPVKMMTAVQERRFRI